MKKILLVNKSFELGGIQSSMVNMANELSKLYDVHLFLYNPRGIMKDRLNSNITILDTSWRLECLGMSFNDVLKTKKIRKIVFRFIAGVWAKLFSNKLPIDLALKHQKKLSGYDLAIAYHHEQSKASVVSGFSRMVDKCVDAKKKVSWVHFDSQSLDLDSDFNNKFYNKMDKIVFVSKSLMNNFVELYPEFDGKVDYCYNFMLYDIIKQKSTLTQQIPYPENKFICISACRFSREKALVRGIHAFSDILKSNPDVMWYIAGDGVQYNIVKDTIKECNLEDQIILLGNQANPYPYIKNADLMINISYHEAAPMVFLESKSLGVPVFATRTSSAEELLNNKKDSFICENSEEEIRESFNWLISNKHLVDNAKKELVNHISNNDSSILKIKEMIG